jgi:iron-sulfur cluster assembly protein
METAAIAPVNFTKSALNEIKRLINEPGFDSSKYLRVGVKGGGCSGLSYVLGFDNKEETDDLFDVDGVPVIISPAHGIYLAGMEINWETGLNARGFTFTNPNASTTCGCGSSFAV